MKGTNKIWKIVTRTVGNPLDCNSRQMAYKEKWQKARVGHYSKLQDFVLEMNNEETHDTLKKNLSSSKCY